MSQQQTMEIELDSFKEQLQAGMEQAAEMLSKFLEPGFNFRVRNPGGGEKALPDADDQIRIGVCLKIDGAVSGLILLLFPTASACELAGLLLRQPPPEDFASSAVHSTLNEVGNIFASGILFCLDDNLKLRALPSPPTFLSGTREQVQEQCQRCCNQPGEVLQQVELACVAPSGELFKGSVIFKLTEQTLQQFKTTASDDPIPSC